MTSESMLFSIISLIINIILQANGYLQQIEINAINDLYNSLNGKYWTGCQWNMTMINNTNKDHIVRDHCGILSFDNNVWQPTVQQVGAINFGVNLTRGLISNVTGFIPQSIGNFSGLMNLYFWYNNIHGDIPSELCNLKHLINIMIVGTDLQNIPSCIFNSTGLGTLAFQFSEKLSVNDKNIKQLCNNKHIKYKFMGLTIQNINYTGSIPECIGYDLPMLSALQFISIGDQHNPIQGSIPSSINNLNHLTQISFYDIIMEKTGNHSMNLSFKNPSLVARLDLDLDLVNINIYDLCNASRLSNIHLINNDENHLVHVPMQCLFKDDNKFTTFILSGPGLIATVNDIICNQNDSLDSFGIINGKYIDINIPQCLFYFPNLVQLHFTNNPGLHSLPSHMINSSILSEVIITNNANLQTRVATLFTKNSFQNLQILLLDNNDFFDQNINEFLHNIFINSPKLVSFTLHGNKYLSGSLPSLSDNSHDIFMDNLQILTLHDLDLHGTIPNYLHLSRNVSMSNSILITLHNNRLSGTIPIALFLNIKDNQHNINFDPIILLGNKFTVEDHTHNQWLQQNSLFTDVSALYISKMDSIKSYIIVAIACGSLLIYMILLFVKKRLSNKLMTYLEGKEQILFLYNLDIINNLLIDPILLCLSTTFIIFYACNSKYYTENTVLSMFSLYNYYSNDSSVNIVFAVLTLLLNIIIIIKVKQIHESMSQTRFNKWPCTEKMYDNCNEKKRHCRIYTNELCSCTLYFVVFMVILSFVFGYGLFSSLPSNNVFNLNSYSSLKAVTWPLSLVLSISKSIIIPKFTNSLFNTFNISYKYRNKCIMMLRTIMVIIIPFMSSIFFINACGGEWSLFWNNCNSQNKYQFDVNATITTQEVDILGPNHKNAFWFAPQTMTFTNLLTSKEVCDISIPSSNNVEKCMREFFDLWTNVLFESMIIMIFMPIFIVIFKVIRYKCAKNRENDNTFCIRIDSAYVMITNKLEICLIFTLICPLILPLIITILKWNEIFYYFMIRKLKWNVTFSYNIDIPTGFLYFSLFMSHLFAFLFLLYYQYITNRNYNIIVSILFVTIIIITYVSLWLYSKSAKKQSINDDQVLKLVDNELTYNKAGSINDVLNTQPIQN
eukprot:552965_1